MSASLPFPCESGKIAEFISFLQQKLMDESMATVQRQELAAAIGHLESACSAHGSSNSFSRSGSRRSSGQAIATTPESPASEAGTPPCTPAEEHHPAALLRKAMRLSDEEEQDQGRRKKRKSLLELPRSEGEPFSVIVNRDDDNNQIAHASSIIENLFGSPVSRFEGYMDTAGRIESNNHGESGIQRFCEEFAKNL